MINISISIAWLKNGLEFINTMLLDSIEYSNLQIEYCFTGSNSNFTDQLEHIKTIPETIVAQCLSGQYEVWANGEHAQIAAGDYFCVAPMQTIRIRHHHNKNGEMSARWVHIKTRAAGLSDFFQGCVLPLHLPQKQNPIIDTHFDLLHQLSASDASLLNALHYQTACFALCAALIDCAGTQEQTQIHHELRTIYQYVETHLHEEIHVSDLAQCMHLSEARFFVVFKSLVGSTPKAWLQDIRLQRCAHLLLNSELTLHSIAERCGFANAFHLSRLFKQWSGLSPKHWRQEHQQRLV